MSIFKRAAIFAVMTVFSSTAFANFNPNGVYCKIVGGKVIAVISLWSEQSAYAEWNNSYNNPNCWGGCGWQGSNFKTTYKKLKAPNTYYINFPPYFSGSYFSDKKEIEITNASGDGYAEFKGSYVLSNNSDCKIHSE